MRKNEKKLLICMASLMMLDYLFTYIGINVYGFIEEANPFMVWLFELPFWASLLLRGLFILSVSMLYFYLCQILHPIRKWLISVGLFANVSVTFVHFYWVSQFFLYIRMSAS